LLLLRASGADGVYTPALFLASGQRASGVHERPLKAVDNNRLFLYHI